MIVEVTSPRKCPRCGQNTLSRTMEKYPFEEPAPVDADEYYKWVCINEVNGKACGQVGGMKLSGKASRDKRYIDPPSPETYTTAYDG